ncbi:glycosyltransferase [Polaribacter sp. Hel1_85]|uniref:glycosyltransferase n=1 Tax=Polaribacter sp. Hel1_85 TaxID=1250005 RepID=UPI00052B5C95|nr:glycosyltransferase [Polaribacter sp. Hel1_85]KGL64352.1 glycosyltransferase, GT4 family [Polaribacter sp. Hel1_85]
MKIIYNFTNIPSHYRGLLWEKLLTSNFFEFHFFFAVNNKLNIKEIDFKKESFQKYSDRLHIIKNYWLKKRILIWQSGVIKSCLTDDLHTAIFLGEIQVVSTWLAMLICKIRRIQVVYWTHGIYGNESYLKKKIRVLFYKTADKILLYERRAEKLLITEGVKEEKILVIFNSLNYDKHIKIRKKIDTLKINNFSNEFTFEDKVASYLIFVGRLTGVKKLDLIIKALKTINNKEKKLNLLIVGKGDPEITRELKQLVKDLNLEARVQFYGACYDEERLANFIYFAELCVSPGNVGLTAIHALSFGTPVCTHSNFFNQMPEVEVIEEGVTGCFFEENNIQLLEKVILNWINSNLERKVIRKDCYTVIDNLYNPYNQVEIMKKLLNK